MKRIPWLLAGAVLCLAVLPLRAQDTDDMPDLPDTPDVAPAVGRGLRVFAGKIHEVRPEGFEIMPWVARFPRRMDVTTTESTRYFDLTKGHQRDLKPGDAVMFVIAHLIGQKKTSPVPPVEEAAAEAPKDPDVPLTPAEKKAAEKKRKEEEKKKADYDKKLQALLQAKLIPVRGVLRLGTAKDTVLTAPELREGRLLMKAAVPFFTSKREHVRIEDRKSVVPGIILSLTPLTLRIEDHKEEFRLTGDAVVVNNAQTTAQNLKHGQTVLIRSRLGPKDGKVDATVVTVCPQPQLEGSETRRILEREAGVAHPRD